MTLVGYNEFSYNQLISFNYKNKSYTMKAKLLLLHILVPVSLSAQSIDGGKLIEPYPPISGTYSGNPVAQSPDPLVNYRWKAPKHTDDLEIYTLSPVWVKADNESSIVRGVNASSLKIKEPCRLMFDFGRVSAGWLEFDSDNLDAEVEMSISEFNEPAVFNQGSEHPVKTAKPVKYGNTYRLELNKQLYEGVRFGWITIKSISRPADLSSVRLVCQVKPTNYEGSFSCSDTLLTRMWYTGAYTVKLNLQKDYYGAILMERSDRHSWTGDAYPSQAASMVAFGNYDFVKANLLRTATQFNGIASYSLYWVLSLIDYYKYTADRQLLDELLENACKKLDVAYDHYGTNPPLSFSGWDERLGGGFETPDCEESQKTYKMLSIKVWQEFGDLMDKAGHAESAKKYRQYAAEKIQELRKDINWAHSLGVHAATNAISAGFTDSKEQQMLWNTAFSDRLQRVSYSPFNQYFIIMALAKMQRHAEALTTIDDCWGGQLRYGGTTFFEVFRPSWNTISHPNDAPVNNQCGYTSLTHPWSAGITKWLTEEILGVKPANPGFTSFSILPHLSDRITSVKGSVPTLNGLISASFDIRNGTCKATIPSGTSAVIGIPKAGRTIRDIQFGGDGNPAKIKEDKDFVYYQLMPGDYSATIKYTGKPSRSPKEKLTYACGSKVKEDTRTQGNWRNKYGRKGYILCNFDSVGNNLIQLPDFVQDVVFKKEKHSHWISKTSDKRALLSPASVTPALTESDTPHRSLGCIYTQDPIPCQQTMTVDIPCKKQQKYQLTLYMVDWDHKGRRSAVEVFDLDTKNLLMPVYMVRNYENGKYITFELDRPARIRINQVRGDNATLSGLFFD